MSTEAQKLKRKLKDKDKEIAELKELLASAETEIKELNDFTGFEKPKKSVLESKMLNTGLKALLFLLVSAAIIGIGIYPWLNRDRFVGNPETATPAADMPSGDSFSDGANEAQARAAAGTATTTDEGATPAPDAADAPDPTPDPPQPQKIIEVVSDLGWLNVRNQPSVQEGDIIEKINSGETYEWTEKTNENWYKIILKDGRIGYVSGEYVQERS